MALSRERTEWLLIAILTGLALLVGFLAGVQPKLAIAAALGCGFVMLVFGDLAAGLAVFSFLGFIELLGFGSIVSVGKLGGALLALAWLALVTTRVEAKNDFGAAHPAATALLGLFVGWAFLSVAWAEVPTHALGFAIRYALNIVLFLIVFTALRTLRQAVVVTGAFLAGAVAASLYGVIGGTNTAEFGSRVAGTNLDPNELASVLVAGVVLSAALAVNLKDKPGPRLAALAGGGFCLITICLTLSRGGILALIVAMIGGIALAGSWRPKVAVATLLVALITVSYFAFYATPQARDRITSSTQGETRRQEGRSTIWEVGWRMVKANPIIGVGAGNFPDASGRYLIQPGTITRSDQVLIEKPQPAHNSYLGVLAELGIVGASMFIGIIVFCLVCAMRAARIFQRLGNVGGDALARGMTIALIGTLTADFFISQELNKQLWLLLAVCPALLAIAHNAEEDAISAQAARLD